MRAEFRSKGQLDIPEALMLDHDEARAVLACATAEPGPIGKAAMRVSRFCLPHFEQEEKIVFPVFGLLPDLALGNIRPEMADLLPLIYEFRAGYARRAHRLIDAAIQGLLQAARAEGSAQFAEFASRLQIHERVEDEVVYPVVILIGRYLRASLEPHFGPRVSNYRRAWLRPPRAQAAAGKSASYARDLSPS